MQLSDRPERGPAAIFVPTPEQAARYGAGVGRGTVPRAFQPKQTHRFPEPTARLKQKNRPARTNGGLEAVPRLTVGRLERTKRLILAATRLWELKRGIRG